MKRIGLAIGIVVLLGIVASPFLIVVSVWDGHFKLNATLRSMSSQPIKNISCAFSFKREEADWLSTSDDREAESSFVPVERFDGKTAVAYGQCSGRNWCGVEYGYVADKFVVFRVDFANGKISKVIAEQPVRPGPRNIEVEIP